MNVAPNIRTAPAVDAGDAAGPRQRTPAKDEAKGEGSSGVFTALFSQLASVSGAGKASRTASDAADAPPEQRGLVKRPAGDAPEVEPAADKHARPVKPAKDQPPDIHVPDGAAVPDMAAGTGANVAAATATSAAATASPAPLPDVPSRDATGTPPAEPPLRVSESPVKDTPQPDASASSVARQADSARLAEAKPVRWVTTVPLGPAPSPQGDRAMDPTADAAVTATAASGATSAAAKEPVVVTITGRTTSFLPGVAAKLSPPPKPAGAPSAIRAENLDPDTGDIRNASLPPVEPRQPEAPRVRRDSPKQPNAGEPRIADRHHAAPAPAATPSAAPPAQAANPPGLAPLVAQGVIASLGPPPNTAPAAETSGPAHPSPTVETPSPGPVQTVSVTLETAEHGALDIRMNLTGRSLSLHFKTERPETAERLRRDDAALGALLSDHGYDAKVVRIETRHLAQAGSPDGARPDSQAAAFGSGNLSGQTGGGRQGQTPTHLSPPLGDSGGAHVIPDSNENRSPDRGTGGLYI